MNVCGVCGQGIWGTGVRILFVFLICVVWTGEAIGAVMSDGSGLVGLGLGWGGVWNECRNGNVRDVSEGVVGLMVRLCELGLGVNWWGGIEMAEREVAGCEHDDTASAESERAEGAGARACGDGRGAFICGYPGECQ